MSKLNLDRDLVDNCFKIAEQATDSLQKYIQYHGTVSIERATLRLFGVQGMHHSRPLVNEVVDRLDKKRLSFGIAYSFCRALAHHSTLSPQELANRVAAGKINLNDLPDVPFEKIVKVARDQVYFTENQIRKSERERQNVRSSVSSESSSGLLKLIRLQDKEDESSLVRLKSILNHGGDGVVFSHPTSQQLFDGWFESDEIKESNFVGPKGIFPSSFKKNRSFVNECSTANKRYIRLFTEVTGLSAPEMAAASLQEGMDGFISDPLDAILSLDLNPKRVWVDHHFVRTLATKYGLPVQSGGENFFPSLEPIRLGTHRLVWALLNEALIKRGGGNSDRSIFGFFCGDEAPGEDSLFIKWAQIELMKELFGNSNIKWILSSDMKQDLSWIGLLQGKGFLELDFSKIPPSWQKEVETFGFLKRVQSALQSGAALSSEIQYQSNGRVIRFARQMLEDSFKLLKKIAHMGILSALDQGALFSIYRPKDGGRGLEGVFQKDKGYLNPFISLPELSVSVSTQKKHNEEKGAFQGEEKQS